MHIQAAIRLDFLPYRKALLSGGESCKQDSCLCAAPCRGNKPLCGIRGAQRVGEDESSLLDYTAPRRGNKLPFHHAKIICPIIFPAVQAYKSIGQSTAKDEIRKFVFVRHPQTCKPNWLCAKAVQKRREVCMRISKSGKSGKF